MKSIKSLFLNNSVIKYPCYSKFVLWLIKNKLILQQNKGLKSYSLLVVKTT